MQDSLLIVEDTANNTVEMTTTDMNYFSTKIQEQQQQIETLQSKFNVLQDLYVNLQLSYNKLSRQYELLNKNKLDKFENYIINKENKHKISIKFRKFLIKFIFKKNYLKDYNF